MKSIQMYGSVVSCPNRGSTDGKGHRGKGERTLQGEISKFPVTKHV